MADGYAETTFVPLEEFSELQVERLAYVPSLPEVLTSKSISTKLGDATAARCPADEAALRSWFPHTAGAPIVHFTSSSGTGTAPASSRKLRVGVVFNGRQAPGGQNVIAGLYDQLIALNPANELIGFMGGSRGLFAGKTIRITNEVLSTFRNQGGFHLLGRSVDKIRSEKEQAAALATCNALALDGLLVIGGTFTNTDAAHLAEYFAEHQAAAATSSSTDGGAAAGSTGGVRTAVVGVPVTIDGDLSNEFVEATLGFDTATKVFSQLVGNMAIDGNSAKKYWYCIRLMGRAVGHIALETALRTHPNVVLLGEDIEARKLTLSDIVREVADVVEARAASGKNFGVLLVPEGTIMSIPETRTLIGEMNALFRENPKIDQATVTSRLTPWSAAVLAYLPALIRQQLFLERESSGAVQLSQISTERMIAELVGDELGRRKAAGGFKGGKYASITHAFGYQGRSSLPSNFDCAYGVALGRSAGVLVAGAFNGYMATVRNLARPVAEWKPLGVPLTAMCSIPRPGSVHEHAYTAPSAATGGAGATGLSSPAAAKCGMRPVIESRPVDVSGSAFAEWRKSARAWQSGELYTNPGPIQYDGETADETTITLTLEKHDYIERIIALRAQLDAVKDMCRPGVSEAVLDSALTGATSLLHILEVMKRKE